MVAIPTIHPNGTSRNSLEEAHHDAIEKVREAIEALKKTQPNGRDFYPQGANAINRATREYSERLKGLVTVEQELMDILMGIGIQD